MIVMIVKKGELKKGNDYTTYNHATNKSFFPRLPQDTDVSLKQVNNQISIKRESPDN